MTKTKNQSARKVAVTAVLAAMSSALMFLDFSIPIMPSFIKLDFSELPALIASYALGPWYGVCVCLVKNLVNLLSTTTAGVGELSNFILGSVFVLFAGYIYKFKKNRTGALIGALAGAACMALISLFSNYYIVYDYANFSAFSFIVSISFFISLNKSILLPNKSYISPTFLKGCSVSFCISIVPFLIT